MTEFEDVYDALKATVDALGGTIVRVGYAPAASSNGSPKPQYARPVNDGELAA